jgi:hypothetical protein
MQRRLCLALFLLLILNGLAGCENQSRTATRNQAAKTTQLTRVNPTPTSGNQARALQQVTASYYRVIQTQNYPLAYTYLDTNATDTDGQKITLDSFEQMAQEIDSQEGPVINFAAAAYPPLVIMTVTRTFQGAYHVHLQMKQEGTNWKIIELERI